jgi:hypothetical protein
MFEDYEPYYTMTPKDQRNITNDWSVLVPDMKRINSKPMLLCKRLGPILVYLGLQKNSSATTYKVLLLCHPLYRPFPAIGIMSFIVKSPGNITLKTHESRYKGAFEALQAKASFQLKEKVSLKEVVTAYRNYILEQRFVISEIYDQALIPAWAGDHELAQESLEWAIEHQDKVLPWNMMGAHQLEDGNEWISDLRQKIANPELLREIVKSEVKKHKLEKIPFYNFVDATYQE